MTTPLRSLLLLGALQQSVLLLMSLHVWMSRGFAAPARRGLLGIALLVAAIVLLARRDTLPGLVSVVVANALLVAGVRTLYACGYAVFGLSPPPRWERWAAFGGVAVLALLWWLDDSAGQLVLAKARPAASGVPLGCSAFCWLQRLSGETPTPRSLGVRYAMGGGALTLLNQFVRSAGSLALPGAVDPMDSPLAGVALVTFLTSTLLSAVGAILEIERRGRVTLELRNEQLTVDASTDSLTGLANRRRLDASGAIEVARARRYEWPIAVLLLDIDHFKTVNDRFGHATGDIVLREVAKLCGAELRGHDVLARWGGEEFALLLPQCDLAAAMGVAERILDRLRSAPLSVLDGGGITMSIGAAVVADGDVALAPAMERADAALYRAKREGRDRAIAA